MRLYCRPIAEVALFVGQFGVAGKGKVGAFTRAKELFEETLGGKILQLDGVAQQVTGEAAGGGIGRPGQVFSET